MNSDFSQRGIWALLSFLWGEAVRTMSCDGDGSTHQSCEGQQGEGRPVWGIMSHSTVSEGCQPLLATSHKLLCSLWIVCQLHHGLISCGCSTGHCWLIKRVSHGSTLPGFFVGELEPTGSASDWPIWWFRLALMSRT